MKVNALSTSGLRFRSIELNFDNVQQASHRERPSQKILSTKLQNLPLMLTKSRTSNKFYPKKATPLVSYRQSRQNPERNIWPFNESKGSVSARTEIENQADQEVKYKNLERLLTSQGLEKYKFSELSKHLNKKADASPDRWQNLPFELKRMPLFQEIIVKENKNLPNPITTFEDKEFKVNIKMRSTSLGLRPVDHSDGSLDKQGENLPVRKQKFYEIATLGYQNYKYRKLPSRAGKERKKSVSKAIENKTAIEYYIHDMQNQRKIISRLHTHDQNQKREILKREYNPKRFQTQDYTNSSELLIGHVDPDNEHEHIIEEYNNVLEPNSLDASNVVRHRREDQKEHNKFKIRSSNSLTRIKSEYTKETEQSAIAQGLNSQTDLLPNPLYQSEAKLEYNELCRKTKMWLDNYTMTLSSKEDIEKTYDEMVINNLIQESGIGLHVFIESQDILKNHKKLIRDRILLALEINPSNKLFLVNWDTFWTFKSIFIYKTFSYHDIVDFIIQFFKVEDRYVHREDFLLLLKNITDKTDDQVRFAEELNGLYQIYVENYKLYGVISFDTFKEVYLQRKMHILDLLELISNPN